MTFRPGTFSRGAIAALVVAVACLAGPVASAGAQAPDTTILTGPSGPTNDVAPVFTFSSSVTTFQCRDYPAAETPPDFATCMSPYAVDPVPLAEGGYVFEVRAVDAMGDPGPTATRSFQVDTTDPETMIDSGPPGLTNDSTPDFTFSSPEANVTFECQYHRAGDPQPGFGACAQTLPDGVYDVEVRAVDAAGNPDDSPAPWNFTLDATAPVTTIVSGPAGLSNDATPEFAFSSTEGGSFECRHYRSGEAAPAFAACGVPYAPGPLGDGAYVFEVVALDAAGNPDDTPASFGFEIDTTPPETTITGGPGDTTAATAVFLFSAPGAASFLCRLDGAAWEPCGAPRTYSPLGLGPHQFEVMAVDAAGNQDPTPAGHAWQVLRPGLVIPGAVEQATALAKELVQMRRALARIRLRTLARRRAVVFRTYDALTAGTVEVRARARVRQGGRRRWIGVLAGERDVPGAGRHRVRAKVTKKARRLARRRKTLPLELRLSFTDRAGRSLWATTKLILKR